MAFELRALTRKLASLFLTVSFVATAAGSAAAPPKKRQSSAPLTQSVAVAPNPVSPPAPTTDQVQCAVTVLRAAARQDWSAYRLARICARDPQVQEVLAWRLAVGDRSASFSELDDALRTQADWPRADLVRQRAAAALSRTDLPAGVQIAWLQNKTSSNADEVAQLALALAHANRVDGALEAARRAFASENLSAAAENELWAAFSSGLTQTEIAARVSALQWRGEQERAKRYRSFLSSDMRAVAEAWVAIASARDATAYGSLSVSLQTKPELLFAEVQRLRRTGAEEAAARLAAGIVASDAPASARVTIFQERRRLVPRLLSKGAASVAYALVADSGLDRGEVYADAEWLAGWIALRYLNDSERAEQHFVRLAERVSTPVSLARAYYWLAQAERAQGKLADAEKHLAQAASLPPTFFGQLAAAQQTERSTPALRALESTPEQTARFDDLKFVRTLRWLAEAGDRAGVEMMTQHIAGALNDPTDYTHLATLVRDAGFPGPAVRAAKIGVRRGQFSLDAAYPLADLPQRAQRLGPEQALVLAVIRQESEWDPAVVSPAGAMGLMQLMPATARVVSLRHGLPVQTSKLAADTDYNITLGAAYLRQLIDEFGGSYVLAIAAYNAGPARVREWIIANGDPRLASVDTVDWIERIPFAETRNYVQRVLENLQVYRQRLTDDAKDMTLTEDLDRGARPA